MAQRKDFVLIFAASRLHRFSGLARSCTEGGMVGDFLLVDENRRAELHVGRKVVEEIDYLAYLATRPGGTEAVTVVTLACGDVADETTRRERASLVRDLRTRCREMKIGFREGTVSVPIGSRELSPTFVELDWAFNLVAVPQDWTGEQGQIGLPLTDEVAQDVAFNAVMSVTGLWAWSATSPLYQGILEEHLQSPPIRLVRAATRIVPLGDFAESIVSAAMDPSNNWPTPPECEKFPNGAAFVNKVVEAVADIETIGLRLKQHVPVPAPSKERVGILDAIVLYYWALVSNLLGAPRRAWLQAKERIIRAAEDYVQDRTFQNESRLVVRFGGRLREEDIASSISERIKAIESESGAEIPAVIPTPQAWRLLSYAVLAAVDGGDSGSGAAFKPPTFRGLTAVASSRSVVGPDPSTGLGEGFVAALKINGKPSTIQLRSFDSIRSQKLRSELHEFLSSSTATTQSHSEGSQQSVDATSKQSESDTSPLSFERQDVEEIAKKLDDWLNARNDTLLWGISKFLDTQLTEVKRLLELSVNRVRAIPQRIREAEAREKRAARRGKWLARLLVLLLVFAVVFPFLPPVASAGLLAGGALAIALFFLPYMALLGVLSAWIASAKSQVREQHRMQRDLVAEHEAAASERHHYWSELHRLEYLHLQYLDWAEILVDVVWRPFGHVDSKVQLPSHVPAVKAISFQFAKPSFDELAVQREQIAMRERVAGRGWLNNIFTIIRKEFEAIYTQLVLDENPSAWQPEMDTSLEDEGYRVRDQVIHKPRTHFMKMIKSGDLAERVAESKAEEIRHAVSRANPLRLTKHVDTHAFVVVDGDVVPRQTADFLLSILDLENVPKFERFVYRTGEKNQLSVGQVYWASVGISPGDDAKVNPVALQLRSDPDASCHLLATTRLEISQARFGTDELRFIEQAPESDDQKLIRETPEPNILGPAID